MGFHEALDDRDRAVTRADNEVRFADWIVTNLQFNLRSDIFGASIDFFGKGAPDGGFMQPFMLPSIASYTGIG